MYYKIENKECEVYKKLHEMRANEIKIDEENRQAIEEKTGLDFQVYLGNSSQQNWGRVQEYTGFQFTEPDKVDLKIWKRHNEHPEIFIPNRKTKTGREMAEFLLNGLQSSDFRTPLDILEVEIQSRFQFAFIHIIDEIIVMSLDDNMEPQDSNVIEITKREFELICKKQPIA